MKCYLYNSLANNGIKPQLGPGIELTDAVGMDYAQFITALQK